MMPLSTWLAFLVVSLATAFSPGPGVMLALSTSGSAGPRRILYSSAGNGLGVFAVATVAVTGLGLLLQTSAIAFGMLKAAGAGYLIYLGLRQWFRKPAAPAAAVLPAKASGNGGLFLRGLLVALTNPKSVLFFTAIFPQFMPGPRLDAARFFLLTSTFVACTLLAHVVYVALAVKLGKGMRLAGRRRALDLVGGLIFVVLGCFMLTLSAQPAPGARR
ncbi:MAG: LysE family translocator [Pseudomonadota bacterium]